MSQIPIIDIPFEELKHLVLDCIKQNGDSFEFNNFCNCVGFNAVNKELVKNPNPPGFQAVSFPLQKQDENRVREILWDLIIERVLTLGDYSNNTWPSLSLTDYGKKAINSIPPAPNDSTGYLKRIKGEVPQLDSVIETYLVESVRTYNINQLLSSTITLGCASEKALLVLIETFKQTFKEDLKRTAFSKKVDDKFIKTQFDEFNKAFQHILPQLSYELKDKYTNTLAGVFEMIRYNRNAAGHPSGKQVDKDTLFANLQVFIPYCKYIYELKDYLDQNQHD
jgi:hypothetical protein